MVPLWFHRRVFEGRSMPFVARLPARGDLVDDSSRSGRSSDPDDDYLVACAGAQMNAVVVSGDQDLFNHFTCDLD